VRVSAREMSEYGTEGTEVASNIRDLIRRMSQANPLWVHPAFTENCSSWALRRNPRWPDICLGLSSRLPSQGTPTTRHAFLYSDTR